MYPFSFFKILINYRQNVGILMKKIALILSIFLSMAHGNAEIIGDPLILDTIYDEKITENNPRISSLVISAQSSNKNYVLINFKGYDGSIISKNIATILDKYKIQYELREKKNINNRTVKILIMRDE